MFRSVANLFYTLLLLFVAVDAQAQSDDPRGEISGRWDLTIETPEDDLPAWLEIKPSGTSALVGRFVGAAGSVRPISEIKYSKEDETYSFRIPPQWSQREEDPFFEFTLEKEQLTGRTTSPDGDTLKWTGVRAPDLEREEEPEWDEPIHLLDQDLSQWELPENNRFEMEGNKLVNKETGGNLITKEKFEDFKLHAEFRYEEGANSGIYLRGRHEVQITDDYGQKPDTYTIGGIYGFLEPVVNAAREPGKWQTLDITLIGRNVTVELNEKEVISNRPIPGITGGALDSNEGEPGPLLLQGDHGPIEFRNITVTPAVE